MKHILSISYDPMVLFTRQLVLEREGYRVSSALGLEAALEAATQTEAPFDLIVLGHSMPGKDKSGFIKSLRNHSLAPVVFLYWDGYVATEADMAIDVAPGPTGLLTAIRSALTSSKPKACGIRGRRLKR
jgi:DNA-binding response OmpR family regulator